MKTIMSKYRYFCFVNTLSSQESQSPKVWVLSPAGPEGAGLGWCILGGALPWTLSHHGVFPTTAHTSTPWLPLTSQSRFFRGSLFFFGMAFCR